MAQKENLTQGSVAKTLLYFTVPLVLSALFQQLFNWVDAFIVGNINGEGALAGIGATSSIYNLCVLVITGYSGGIAVLVGQKEGSGRREEIGSILGTNCTLLLLVFLPLSIAGILLTDPILGLMHTPEDIFTHASDYLSVIFAGIPFLSLYNVYSAVLRGLGNSRAPFLAILVSSAANIILDLVFVAGFGWGTFGAALATVISQAAMTVFIIVYAIKKYPALKFRFGGNALIAVSASFCLPPAIQSAVTSLGNVILQEFMNGFGSQTVAAITTSYRIDTVILLPIVNLGSGIATIVAQNIGAGNEERAKKVLRVGLAMMCIVSLVLTLIVFLFGGDLIAIFGLESETVDIGRSFFRALASFYIVYGISMALRGALEGRGDMLYSGIAGILFLAVRILCSYAFRPVFGNMVIAYAEAMAWFFLLAEFALRYFYKTRKKI